MNLIQYNNYSLRALDELPHHLKYDEYLKLREQPAIYYNNIKNLKTERKIYLIERDTLLIDFCFHTGGRIGDITKVKKEDFDFVNLLLHLKIRKVRKEIKLNISREIMYRLSNFYLSYNKEPFLMSSRNAFNIIRKYGKMINIPHIHPHMFRHGLAIHLLLNEKVDIMTISYRLGHCNVKTTMGFYLRMSEETEKQGLGEFLKK